MRSVQFWSGTHSPDFNELFDRCWRSGALLIVAPPGFKGDTSVLTLLPDEAVLGVYTTGTTRMSRKLVLFSRDNIRASQDSILELFDPRRIDEIFCYPQPYHVFGLLLGYGLAALRGIKIVSPNGPYGRSAHDAWLERRTPSMLTLATPAQMMDLCATIEVLRAKPRATYSCILGGARVAKAVWERARDVARIEQPSIGYGCTEASPGVCHLPPGIAPLEDGEVGFALPHVALSMLGDDVGYELRGPGVCVATVEDGVLTRPDGRVVVRDRLRRGTDGRLIFENRADLVLNRGGEKFALEQVEALLSARLGVEMICVAVPDSRLGEELGVLARAALGVDLASIQSALATEYPRAFTGLQVKTVTSLPLDSSAKPDRIAAKSMFVTGVARG